MCKMADEVFGILFGNVHPVTGEPYINEAREEEYFLGNIITPIYEVLQKVIWCGTIYISRCYSFTVCFTELNFAGCKGSKEKHVRQG